MGTEEFFGSGAVEAVVDEADFTGTIDEVAGRHRGDADCFHELLLPVVEGGEGRREFLREGGGGGGFFVDADGEEDKTARGEIGVDFAREGKEALHGPHHEAQKSMSTTWPAVAGTALPEIATTPAGASAGNVSPILISARASAANARVYALNRTNNGGRKARPTSKAIKENSRTGNAISRIHLVATSFTDE